MLKNPDKSWSLLHSIFVKNLKLYTSQMSSQVAKWKHHRKAAKCENNMEMRASKVNFLIHLRTIFIHRLSRYVWYVCMYGMHVWILDNKNMKWGSQNQSCLLGSYIISCSTYWMKTFHKLFFFHKRIGVEPGVKILGKSPKT